MTEKCPRSSYGVSHPEGKTEVMEALLWFLKLFFTCTHSLSSMTLKGVRAQNNALALSASDLSHAPSPFTRFCSSFCIHWPFKPQFEQMACEPICWVLCVCGLGNQTLWMFVESRHFVSVMYASPAVMWRSGSCLHHISFAASSQHWFSRCQTLCPILLQTG